MTGGTFHEVAVASRSGSWMTFPVKGALALFPKRLVAHVSPAFLRCRTQRGAYAVRTPSRIVIPSPQSEQPNLTLDGRSPVGYTSRNIDGLFFHREKARP